MSRHLVGAVAGFVVVLALGSCSSDFAGVFNDKDRGLPDANPAAFETTSCAVQVIVDPSDGSLPTRFSARADVLHGIRTYDLEWQVTRAGSSTPVATGQGDRISVDAQPGQGGTYHFHAVATRDDRMVSCSGTGTALARPPGALERPVVLRVSPPPRLGLPRQDVILTVIGGAPQDGKLHGLEEGMTVSGVLQGPSAPARGTVRFFAAPGVQTPEVLVATDAVGGFSVRLLARAYLPIFVPFDPQLAPHRGQPKEPAFLVPQDFQIPGGSVVSGTVRDAAGQPLPGARVVLESRTTRLTSSVGITDAGGGYLLRVEDDAYQLSVGAPGWPDIVTPPRFFAAGTVADLSYRVPLVAVTGSVHASDGAAMTGARVTVRSRAPLARAATLSLDGGSAIDAAGAVQRVAVTDAAGALPALALPAGEYDVTVEPPAQQEDGITTTRLVLSQDDHWQLRLAPHILLQGTVRSPRGPIAGARVTAVSRLGLGDAPTTLSDSDGHYVLRVTSGADHEVYAEPPPGTSYLRSHLQAPAGATTADLALPQGQLYGGVLSAPLTGKVAGALLEAYCAGCNDPEPLAIGWTQPDGSFTLHLPDPGP